MRTIKTTTGASINLDGDLLAILETLYREITVKRNFERSFEDMIQEIRQLIDQMTDEERRAYLTESLFLNSVKYENDRAEALMRKLTKEMIALSLNYLATRFQCTWPWSTLVMLCDGRIVCGCADPYGKRVLGDAKIASIGEIWNDTRSARCAPTSTPAARPSAVTAR